MKILIVEDDIHSVKLTTFILTEAGYRVVTAHTGQGVAQALITHTPQLILLDVSLPGINGFDVCRHIRHTSDIPIIFLTGQADLESRVTGLQSGGDDYLIKPFDPAELVARVKAVLRRRMPTMFGSTELLNQGELSLDPTTHTARWTDGRVVKLTPVECRLLTCLMQNAGQVLQTEQLLTMVWRHEHTVATHAIAMYIRRYARRLRRILGIHIT